MAVLTDPVAVSPARTHDSTVRAWLALQLTGQVCLFGLLITYLFSRRLKTQRHPFMINFVATWLLSTFPALLLLYAGQLRASAPTSWSAGRTETSATAFDICLVNAALISGVPPMVAVSFVPVVVQIWYMLCTTLGARQPTQRRWLKAFLLVCPYLVFVAFSTLTGLFGFMHPQTLTRSLDVFYCSVDNQTIGLIIWIFTASVVVLTLALQVAIAVTLYCNWRAMRYTKVSTAKIDLHLVFRVVAFVVFEVLIVVASILAFSTGSLVPRIMQATSPLVVFVFLGSQPDVFFSWFFCFRAAPEPPTISRPMPISEKPVSLIEALEECTFPEAAVTPGGVRPVSNYDATRAAFTSRSRTRPMPGSASNFSGAVIYGSHHGPSASMGSMSSSERGLLSAFNASYTWTSASSRRSVLLQTIEEPDGVLDGALMLERARAGIEYQYGAGAEYAYGADSMSDSGSYDRGARWTTEASRV